MVYPRRASVLAGAALALLLAAGRVQANGRFPRAERLLEQAGDPNRLVLGATYGILVTADRGGEWRHVCELGFAFANAEIDPVVGAFSDGSMIVRGIRSLNRADAPLCTFEPVLGGTGTNSVADFTLDPTVEGRVLALGLERGDGGGIVNRVYESLDAGRTFAPFGAPLPEAEVLAGITLDLIASEPPRLVVTASGRETRSVFARSDDGGEHWTTVPLALGDEEYPYIAAVDPAHPDAVYVRTDQWVANDDGVYEANDALLYSDDGGATFREVLRLRGKLLGFALSPDGASVLAGYGDPVDPSRTVDAAVLGIYRADTSDFAFTKIFEGSVSCLTWNTTGLYACTSQAELGFALGFAPNADFGLADAPFTSLLDLREVAGPVDCPACSATGACLDSWATTCALFGSCDAGTAGTSTAESECEGGAAGTGSVQGGSGGSMPPTSGRGGGSAADGGSSCGCRVPGGPALPWSGLIAFLVGAPFLRRLLRRNAASCERGACGRSDRRL